jgi:hypothetical protein
MEHPTWCDPAKCSVDIDRNRGSHWSRMMVADHDPSAGYHLGVQLSQDMSDAVLVVLTLRFSPVPFAQLPHDDEDVAITLTGTDTRALGRLLVSVGRVACARQAATPG